MLFTVIEADTNSVYIAQICICICICSSVGRVCVATQISRIMIKEIEMYLYVLYSFHDKWSTTEKFNVECTSQLPVVQSHPLLLTVV
jgi:hypothetical protein